MKELQHLKEQVRQIMEAWHVPGAAVGIVKDGEVIFAEGFGYGDLERDKVATADTQFATGSSTKAFTTTAIGMLVADSTLDWDTPVRKYIPEFGLYDPLASERLTLRDMACHRSGLPRYDAMLFNPVFSRQEIMKRLRYLKPTKDFRSTWQYNNLMYATMGYVIERVTGTVWEDFVQQRLLDVLGMVNSTFHVSAMQQCLDFACPYQDKEGKVARHKFMEIGSTGPAGSINSSVNDMVKWVQFNLNKGQWDGQPLIASSIIADIQRPQIPIHAPQEDPEISPASYGLGWICSHYRGHYMVDHGGATVGFQSAVAFMPEHKLGVVVLTNSNSPAPQFVAYRVFDLLLGLEPIDWTARAKQRKARMKESKVDEKELPQVENTLPSHVLTTYVGTYQHEGVGQLVVKLVDGRLKIVYGKVEMSLSHRHFDVFNAQMPDFFSNQKLHAAFHNAVDGSVASVSLPLGLDPLLEDLVFTRIADAKMSEVSFLKQFCGAYEVGGQELKVALNSQGELQAQITGQPLITLIPHRDTVFTVKGLSGFVMEFKTDEVVIHQPNGVFTAKKQ